MRAQLNMTVLGHEEWSPVHETYVETDLPDEPNIDVKVFLDVKAYRKHKPPLACYVNKNWNKMHPNVNDTGVVFSFIADTGAQVCVLGVKHIKKLGMSTNNLLRTRMQINCANKSSAGILGVFYACLVAKHHKSKDEVKTKAMMYVIEGDAMLLSRRTLREFGCISGKFPRAGEFVPKDMIDSAVAKSVAYIAEDKEALINQMYVDQSHERISNRVPGSIENEEACDNIVLRQPVGVCDPESDLPCSCPTRKFIDPPTTLPMPATKSNREALENWIKDYYKAGAFNVCKRQKWPAVSGPPMRMHTSPGAVPAYHRKPTKVPLHFREEVRLGVEADVKKGILERVPPGEADTWCSRMVIQPKKSGKARRTVDLSALSRAGQHESHHTRSAADIAKSIPAGMLKSTLDCVDGYHGVELDPRDRHKTTFATEWGLFRYKRVPQGYLSSGDNYTKHTDIIMESCPGKPDTTDRETI